MKKLTLSIIEGVEGPCVVLDNFRIAGPKPWGGGRVSREWTLDVADLLRAIPGLRYEPPGED